MTTVDIMGVEQTKSNVLIAMCADDVVLSCISHSFELEDVHLVSSVDEAIESARDELEQQNAHQEVRFLLFWFPEVTEGINRVLKFVLKNDFSNYRIISEKEYKSIHYAFFIRYFQDKGIATGDAKIHIGDYVVNNFLLSDSGDNNYGDSILPEFFNDYSMLSEGPFEYGPVALKEGDIVFDCGANIGLFSTIALYKSCEVYAFEPTPVTFDLLKDNLANYRHGQYTLLNFGLFDRTYLAEFYLYKYSQGNSMVISHGSSKRGFYPVTTIDQYVQENDIRRIDFIKADIEGAERGMLRGARDTIRKFMPKLSVCTYHFSDDPIVIEDIIRDISPRYNILHRWKKIYAYVD